METTPYFMPQILLGAYTRGESLEITKAKMPQEITSYCKWPGIDTADEIEIVIIGEKCSELAIRDADFDVLFESEQAPQAVTEYEKLKTLALKSAEDFLSLYESIAERKTFYGSIPLTANEMYEHSGNVNAYYFEENDVVADNDDDIY